MNDRLFGMGPVARMIMRNAGLGKDRPVSEVDCRCRAKAHCHDNGEYRMRGSCGNCRAVVIGIFTKGHAANSGVLGHDCPVCGCARLSWGSLVA